ncbi:MAG: SDR family oxidoreductase [Planctomycetota bacterium]|nr:SDR family oxidoreductase [Planctomycetota bacterium]
MDADLPIALVTGASRGIGAACALALARGGWRVALQYRERAAEAEAVLGRIRAAGGDGRAFSADLADPGQAAGLVAAVVEKLGPPAALVHAAGAMLEKPLAFTSPAEWSRLLELHALSAWILSKDMLRHLRKAPHGRGRIVFVGSLAGVTGLGNGAAYAATKGALHGLARSLAKECARWGATVNVIAPGYVETEMTAHHDEKRRAANLESIPLGRYAKPEEIAAQVARLCAPEAGSMTGQVMVVDGGMGLG